MDEVTQTKWIRDAIVLMWELEPAVFSCTSKHYQKLALMVMLADGYEELVRAEPEQATALFSKWALTRYRSGFVNTPAPLTALSIEKPLIDNQIPLFIDNEIPRQPSFPRSFP